MKHLLPIFKLIIALNTPIMDDKFPEQHQDTYVENLGLPNEIWDQILKSVYLEFFDATILDKAENIYDAIDIINEHTQKTLHHVKTITMVCKIFKAFIPDISKKQWPEFKQKISDFYISFLNEKFLENRKGKEGLYPKNDEWCKDTDINAALAKFVSKKYPDINISYLLDNWSQNYSSNRIEDNLKLIRFLLFYKVNPSILLLNAIKSHHPLDNNHTEIIKYLLRRGANPNLCDETKRSALHWAVIRPRLDKNDTEIIQLMLKNGANTNLQDEKGNTPLYYTVFNYPPKTTENIEIIKLLLQHKANPNIQNYNQHAVLGQALLAYDRNYQNNTEIVILLLLNGADPDLKENDGKNAFDIARKKKLNHFELLVKYYYKQKN